jgi:hypothetical protein
VAGGNSNNNVTVKWKEVAEGRKAMKKVSLFGREEHELWSSSKELN